MEERKFEPESGRWPRVRPTPCPNCGGEMHHGRLRTPGRMDSKVFIEGPSGAGSQNDYQRLDVWVCKECGYVELHTMPSRDHYEDKTPSDTK